MFLLDELNPIPLNLPLTRETFSSPLASPADKVGQRGVGGDYVLLYNFTNFMNLQLYELINLLN